MAGSAAVLVGVVAFAFAPLYTGRPQEFLNWDDGANIVDNVFVRRPSDAASLRWILTGEQLGVSNKYPNLSPWRLYINWDYMYNPRIIWRHWVRLP